MSDPALVVSACILAQVGPDLDPPRPGLELVLEGPAGLDATALDPTVADVFGRALSVESATSDAAAPARIRIAAAFASPEAPDLCPAPEPEADPPAFVLTVTVGLARRSVWFALAHPAAPARPDAGDFTPPAGLGRIGYTARDYAGLRAMMQARIAQSLGGTAAWALDHPADPLTTIVEVLAYAGDQLAFRQDAAGTEAYLPTARRRGSLRRHARLRDYAVDDGCNARTVLAFAVTGAGVLPAGLAVVSDQLGRAGIVLEAGAFAAGTTLYETMAPLAVSDALDDLGPSLAGASPATLAAGAYAATLAGTPPLQAGRLLVLRQRFAPEGATAFGAQALRLLDIAPATGADGAAATRIAWHPEDALARPLTIPSAGTALTAGAVELLANVVLADHGRTVPLDLDPPTVPEAGGYRPRVALADPILACPEPVAAPGFPGTDFVAGACLVLSARASLAPDPRTAVPALLLSEGGRTWRSRRDLLEAPAGACLFAVETDADGLSLRFGDGVLGRVPAPGLAFSARARTGDGVSGQVRAGALVQVVGPAPLVRAVSNPLPAAPSPREGDAAIRLFAASGFRAQARGITADDWMRLAGEDPLVASVEAAAPDGGPCAIGLTTGPDDETTFAVAAARLGDLAILGAAPTITRGTDAPLDVALAVYGLPGADIPALRLALARALGPGRLPDGNPAFLDPALWPLGRAVVLSDLTAAVAQVPGVAFVVADPEADPRVRFRLRGQEPDATAANVARGRIAIGPAQRARANNDPLHPEAGSVVLYLVAAPDPAAP